MSYYRDVYLKSDDWKSLRAAKLWHQNGRCQVCGEVSQSNDVHHVKYKRLLDVTLLDLKVLCRTCHNATHALLDKYPLLKKLHTPKLWKTVIDHLKKGERHAKALEKSKRLPSGKRKRMSVIVPMFSGARAQLVLSGAVFKSRMPWRDELLDVPGIKQLVSASPEFIDLYKSVTGIDPRANTGMEQNAY